MLLPAKRGRSQTSRGNAAQGMILISSFVFAVFIGIVGTATPITSTCSAQAISDDVNRKGDSLYSDTYRYRNRQLLGLRGALAGEETETLKSKSAVISSVAPVPSTNFTIPLHAHSGSHHVHIYVGSPPQRQIVSRIILLFLRFFFCCCCSFYLIGIALFLSTGDFGYRIKITVFSV